MNAELPNVSIRYSGLTYSVKLNAEVEKKAGDNFGSALLSMLMLPVSLIIKLVQFFQGDESFGPKTRDFNVLDNVDGRIEPGKMTLILAPPGHGKSGFLKALARLLPANLVSGNITFSGKSADQCLAEGIHLGHLVQYIDQLDQHLPFLTVRETFDFVNQNANIDPAPLTSNAELLASHRNRLDTIVDMLNLRGCIDTIVGDNVVRGISGGEKKRVTVGEGLLTNARVLLMDEISTGLDSSVTFDIVKSLHRRCREQNLAVVIALLQPTPEVYRLFDEVILLREGAVIYHGARDQLPDYLMSLGFELPIFTSVSDEAKHAVHMAEVGNGRLDLKRAVSSKDEVDVADFLSDIVFKPFKYVDKRGLKTAPLTTPEMVDAWKKSSMYQQLIELPLNQKPLSLDSAFAREQYGKPYAHNIWYHFQILLKRQFILLSRNRVFLGIRLFGSLLISFVIGSM